MADHGWRALGQSCPSRQASPRRTLAPIVCRRLNDNQSQTTNWKRGAGTAPDTAEKEVSNALPS